MTWILSNVAVEWLIFLPRIRQITGSNLGPKAGYPDRNFSGFTQSLQTNVGIVR
jgi:hypothetical protein